MLFTITDIDVVWFGLGLIIAVIILYSLYRLFKSLKRIIAYFVERS